MQLLASITYHVVVQVTLRLACSVTIERQRNLEHVVDETLADTNPRQNYVMQGCTNHLTLNQCMTCPFRIA